MTPSEISDLRTSAEGEMARRDQGLPPRAPPLALREVWADAWRRLGGPAHARVEALRRARRLASDRGHVAGILARKRARAGARRPRVATGSTRSSAGTSGGPAPPPPPLAVPDFRRFAGAIGARTTGPTLAGAGGRRQASYRPAPPLPWPAGRGPAATEGRPGRDRVREGAARARGRGGRPSSGGRP